VILRGHSGCSLELTDKGIVRKTSKNKLYNERLYFQIEKQKYFSHPILQTPRVLETGIKNGLFYCDMEYIPGVSFQEYCSYTPYDEAKKLFEKLLTTDEATKDCTKEIYEKCLSLSGFPMEILDEVSWVIPVGSCHGDLTFENILIKDNNIYVIDFLDSFVESSLIDQSKLMQDTFCAWSFREKNYTPWHHLYLLNNLIHDKRNYILLLIHLYRILPYSNTQITKLLKCKILKVKEILKRF
jgi:serine/threonine protein kinase